jgi:hypothetical protein
VGVVRSYPVRSANFSYQPVVGRSGPNYVVPAFQISEEMKAKSFKITFALKEGYSPKGKVHNVHGAAKVIRSWMEERLKTGETVLSGMLQQGQLFFPSPDEVTELVTVSPTAIYYGELSSPEDLKRTTKEIKATLASLAVRLKEELNQESVFIIYQSTNWCV